MPNSRLPRLEHRLILFQYFCHLFGAKDTRDYQSALKDVAEGYDAEGHSNYLGVLSRRDGVLVSTDQLIQYDDNIKSHLVHINTGRRDPVSLKYFQYLPLLFTEIYLDRYFHNFHGLLTSLNSFIDRVNDDGASEGQPYPHFTEHDLNKIALWMATGSGKTLLMHINFLQFIHYNTKPIDNVILLTPNEGLSAQHMEEMQKSNIPCSMLIDSSDSLFSSGPRIRVIEISKLTEEKKGEGVSIDVATLEGNNLLFVDEGHKGTKSDEQKWRKLREAVGGKGFIFEYSATFGQAVNSAGDEELLREYSQSILFDYSYRFFYGDGYGKDYLILNLREETAGDHTDMLLLGNLLSFYEQRLCYDEERHALREYNIEPPLWIFVGGSVNVVFTEEKRRQSDVLRILRFIERVLKNERGWVQKSIDRILDGKSGLKEDDSGQDVFRDKLQYLRKRKRTADSLYRAILETVFRTSGGSGLHLAVLKNADGEIGLKAGNSEIYFGVVNIGDTSEFLKLVDQEASGLVREDDAISKSLFAYINRPDSTVNILIGAKKFIEGWSSWRVSTMGLLNIGRGEGTQIIQLFGRGVRLLGKSRSLKRTTKADPDRPSHVALLETLNIFGVRANYMATFREYLRENDMEEEWERFELKVKQNEKFYEYKLVLPAIRKDAKFESDELFSLEFDESIKPVVDIRPSVQIKTSIESAASTPADTEPSRIIHDRFIPLMNWVQIYLRILDYKRQRGYWNLHVSQDVLREITASQLYKLYCAPELMTPKSFDGVRRLEDLVLIILRKYVDQFYSKRRRTWENSNRVAQLLVKDNDNIVQYTISVNRKQAKPTLLKEIRKLLKEAKRIYREDEEVNVLKFIHFDRHLYQPLVRLKKSEHIKVDPPALDEGGGEGEGRFIEDLKTFVQEHKETLKGKEIFVLRNIPHRGVGFFDDEQYYPDFILWIKEGKKQRMVFVDPKGILHMGRYHHKIQLHKTIKSIEQNLSTPRRPLTLDSYIISSTPFSELKAKGEWQTQAEAEANNILFFENPNYLQKIVS